MVTKKTGARQKAARTTARRAKASSGKTVKGSKPAKKSKATVARTKSATKVLKSAGASRGAKRAATKAQPKASKSKTKSSKENKGAKPRVLKGARKQTVLSPKSRAAKAPAKTARSPAKAAAPSKPSGNKSSARACAAAARTGLKSTPPQKPIGKRTKVSPVSKATVQPQAKAKPPGAARKNTSSSMPEEARALAPAQCEHVSASPVEEVQPESSRLAHDRAETVGTSRAEEKQKKEQEQAKSESRPSEVRKGVRPSVADLKARTSRSGGKPAPSSLATKTSSPPVPSVQSSKPSKFDSKTTISKVSAKIRAKVTSGARAQGNGTELAPDPNAVESRPKMTLVQVVRSEIATATETELPRMPASVGRAIVTAGSESLELDSEAAAKKKRTALTKTQLAHFRDLLLKKREILAGDLNRMENEALRPSEQDVSVDNVADHGSDSWEQQFTLGLIENEEATLRDIDDALQRIDRGLFGGCEECHEPIPVARLEAIPYARLCVHCQRVLESD